ncbi:methylaspartate mutase [Spirochaetia bacterium]|nr:methylaspartate mutase [Spirochaetia bacterium]
MHYILLDFGSTFTKAAVVDVDEKRVIYTTKTVSTVSTDARIAMEACYANIKAEIGNSAFEAARKMATSSAAGGLRMVVAGLTYSLSLAAGKNAAFGAGAKILKTFARRLTPEDIAEIESLNVEIILICGGYEEGNIQDILHNVDMLSKSKISVPFIYAGNSTAAKAASGCLRAYNKTRYISQNIIPRIGVLNARPTEQIIRSIFLERIVNMKGLGTIKSGLDNAIIPTPAAVLEAGNLLSCGTKTSPGLGPLMVVDIGGATTDVHTFCLPRSADNAKIIGSPEPYAKRTVEADLGMRESSCLIMEQIGYDNVSKELGISEEHLCAAINNRVNNIGFLPENREQIKDVYEEQELAIDHKLSVLASNIAVRRHAGCLEPRQSKVCSLLQHGKNLEDIRLVIGTGGPIINSRNPAHILRETLKSDHDRKFNILLPKNIDRLVIDADYIMYAMGILKDYDPDVALTIMKNSLRDVA